MPGVQVGFKLPFERGWGGGGGGGGGGETHKSHQEEHS